MINDETSFFKPITNVYLLYLKMLFNPMHLTFKCAFTDQQITECADLEVLHQGKIGFYYLQVLWKNINELNAPRRSASKVIVLSKKTKNFQRSELLLNKSLSEFLFNTNINDLYDDIDSIKTQLSLLQQRIR